MKCEDIRLHLEQMSMGELSEAVQGVVTQHLNSCPGCAREYRELKGKAALLGKNKAPAKAPDYLEGRIRRSFKKRYARNWAVPKAAIAALLALAVFSTVYAQATTGFLTDWDTILNLFAAGDRGIEHSLRLGAGQMVDQQQIIDGVTVHLHSLIADGNRTIVLFSVDGPEDADFARIESFRITDPGGKSLTQQGGYSFANGKATGKIETVSADQLGKKLTVALGSIIFGRTHEIENLALDVSAQYPKTIVLDGNMGKIVIEEVNISQDKITVITRTQFTDHHSSSLMFNLYQGEELLRNNQSIISGNRMESTWTLNDSDGSNLLMYFRYQETLAAITEPVSFEVEIDKAKIQEHTVTHNLDKKLELEPGVLLNFERIVATSSQTVIQFSIDGEQGPRAIQPDALEMMLKADGQLVYFDLDYQGGKHMIKFDPTVPLDQLVLEIKGYYMMRTHEAVQYELTLDDQGSTIDFNGIPLKVKEIQVQGSMVRFRLSTLDGPAIINTAALIIDQKEIPSTGLFYRQDPGEKNHHFDILFPAEEQQNNWTLQLGPVWQAYNECNLVIQIP